MRVYIPISLLTMLLIVVFAAVTGVLAMTAARAQRTWFVLLALCTLLSVVGPFVCLAVFRDSPDPFVAVATVLLFIVPLGALSYTVFS